MTEGLSFVGQLPSKSVEETKGCPAFINDLWNHKNDTLSLPALERRHVGKTKPDFKDALEKALNLISSKFRVTPGLR